LAGKGAGLVKFGRLILLIGQRGMMQQFGAEVLKK